jgi:MFS family permease
MSKNALLLIFPFAMDIVIALLLFVGRHSLASRGFDENIVGRVSLFYGIGYVIFGLFMQKIVRAAYVRMEIYLSIALIALCSIMLANTENLLAIQVLYLVIPFGASLYFNAYQAYMLMVSKETAKPLTSVVCHYTFSWSLGFALGPLLSSQLKIYTTWPQTYYLAAGISACLAVLLLSIKTEKAANLVIQTKPVVQDTEKGHPGPAWLGVMLAWTSWTIISVYWPIQATRLDFSPSVKGLVETLFALTQSLFALVLMAFPGRYRRTGWIALFGAIGIAGVLLFGFSNSVYSFFGGILLFGIYTSSMFTNTLYHAMVEGSKAIKRVAVNEVCVGICFAVGPLCASLMHNPAFSFKHTYILFACCLAAGLCVQMFFTYRVLRKKAG